jgi:hypothetical protein
LTEEAIPMAETIQTLGEFVAGLENGWDWIKHPYIPRDIGRLIRTVASDSDLARPIKVEYERGTAGWGPGGYYWYRWTVTGWSPPDTVRPGPTQHEAVFGAGGRPVISPTKTGAVIYVTWP